MAAREASPGGYRSSKVSNPILALKGSFPKEMMSGWERIVLGRVSGRMWVKSGTH